MDRPLFFFSVGFGLGVLLTFWLCINGAEPHAEIITHHAAHYDGQTGKFVWNDETQGVK